MGICPWEDAKGEKRIDRCRCAIRWFINQGSKLYVRSTGKERARKKEKEVAAKKLTLQETDALREVWFAMGPPCGKRMQPALGAWLKSMEKRQDVDIEKLLGVSAATLDRKLAQFKVHKAEEKEEMLHQASLKKSIPYVNRRVKLTEPGHLSADTVAPCNGDMSGDIVRTLTGTDELTGWTQNRAIRNKGQLCTITRSRPNKKNNNARVEERNLHVVRECIGYARLGDEGFVRVSK